MMKRIWLILFTGLFLGASVFPAFPAARGVQAEGLRPVPETAAATAVKGALRMGASGGEVYELQGRLKYLGFYTGKLDGRFGWRTHRAVRRFQSQFGIKVDGVYGPQTKKELREATEGWAPGAENRIYKKGDRGGYVYELQRRLRYLDYYRGKVDGVFGNQTDRAVRDFQYRFGLKSDGKVGARTKLKLWRATRGYRVGRGAAPARPPAITRTKPMTRVPRTTNGVSEQDIRIIAQTVHGEARGEPYVGQVAVAAVILNRMESERFPDTPSAVIYEPMAFTAVQDGQINLAPDQEAKKAVYDALNGWDPSSGALYYFNPATATSGWIWGRPQIKRIGKHIFTR